MNFFSSLSRIDESRASLTHQPIFNPDTWDCTEHSASGYVCSQNSQSLCFRPPYSRPSRPSSLLLPPAKSVFFSSSFSAHDVVNEFESSRSQGLGSGRLEALLLSIPALPVTMLPQGCLFLLGHLGTVMVIRKDVNVLFLR